MKIIKIDDNIPKKEMADKSQLIADILERIDLLTHCFIVFLLTRLVFSRLHVTSSNDHLRKKFELISRILRLFQSRLFFEMVQKLFIRLFIRTDADSNV